MKTDIEYVRRKDLEKEDVHVLIVDVKINVLIQIICVYRSFRPLNRMTPDEFFIEQLKVIKSAMCTNCYIMGDFNLDANMCNHVDYSCRVPLKLLNEFMVSNSLFQIVNFTHMVTYH